MERKTCVAPAETVHFSKNRIPAPAPATPARHTLLARRCGRGRGQRGAGAGGGAGGRGVEQRSRGFEDLTVQHPVLLVGGHKWTLRETCWYEHASLDRDEHSVRVPRRPSQLAGARSGDGQLRAASASQSTDRGDDPASYGRRRA